MVRHSVVFKLKDQISPGEVHKFFVEIKKLTSIPGVKKFECLKQISKKNNYSFGLSMEFDSWDTYDKYSNNPNHTAFVQDYWLKYVKDFMELDFEPLT